MFLSFPERWYLLKFLGVTVKPLFLVHNYVREKLGYLDRWGKWFFSENSLKIWLALIISLPSISLSAIFQPLLGISSQVLDSFPSNLPTLSHLSLFDKIFTSSHKSNSSGRFILSLLWYIFVLFNYIFFCSIYDWMWISKCLWSIFDWQYGGVLKYLHSPHLSQTTFWHENFLSHTTFSVGSLILITYIWS